MGEISLALEKVFNRHAAEAFAVTGVYLRESGSTPQTERGQAMTAAFVQADGRKPRVMVAKMGQDGHDRGQKVIASGFADLGFQVGYRQPPSRPRRGGRPGRRTGRPRGRRQLARCGGHLTLVAGAEG